MKTQCCRSTPRCAKCPVVLRARQRAAERQAMVSCSTGDRRAALVQEILAGRPPRRLPDAVEAALSVLAA